MVSTLEEVLAPIAILVIVILIISLAARGKKLKCPECGTVFAAPAMDNKRSGLGWTFPYTGTIKCPKCGESRPRRDYQKVPASSPPTT